MKYIVAIILTLCFSLMLFAQPKGGPNHNDIPKVEKMVSNLSALQKKRLESITDKSKKEVIKLRSELESVRSQIGKLNNKEGDQSATLFPLFDRECQLMAEISKVMYRCRIEIDGVLTPEQIKEFRKSLEAERQNKIKSNNHKPGMAAKPKQNLHD